MVGPRQVPGTVTTLATVPVGRVWLLKGLMLSNIGNTVTTTIQVSIGLMSTVGNTIFFLDVLPKRSYYQEIRVPMTAGEIIQGLTTAGVGLNTICIAGYTFEG